MRWILALLAILVTLFPIMPLLYRKIGHISRPWRLVCKVLPTLMCAAFAGVAFHISGDPYALLIFIGLCICSAADVLLGIHFVTGGALFLTGHIFYSLAFFIQQRPGWISIPVFVIALCLLWLFLSRFRPLIKHNLLYRGVQLYAAMLAFVLCLTLPMPFRALYQRTVLAALGALLFVLSDMGVCHSALCKVSTRRDACYLGIYYLAQLLLGLSAFGG
ncbi:MAG: lysoplasmalogenase [Clostridia bacterium]|nr:lysoplasmalogenase [Clostridia bacterium]